MNIYINDYLITAEEFESSQIYVAAEVKRLIKFSFKVKHEDYHDVTTLLYQNDFRVSVPDEQMNMEATIYNYSTSFTNLYEEGSVGDFYLMLIEK
ncbi:DUF3219 family protein [Alkalibacillus haloalkaliphilus]|uniref:DUF3219 domain-containing protein n=1 Tax=Alkalibacillus haloalkaliphilus TaxID=94136 RepID=A0A511W3Z8_9BACI|nr:DUF3219 family protein [Alkalibacillus haloalkaliphilus]GEN45481.1 hypothetical protein AHA02nite_12570 [Alkalibacillus haloalkaliphilus]